MTTLLYVTACPISFGCIKAQDIRGNHATIILYEDLLHRYVDIVPNTGDLLLCRFTHSSVYVPVARVVQPALCLRMLPIPSDVLQLYFPLFEPLKR